MVDKRQLLHGWGRTAPSAAFVHAPRSADEIAAVIRSSPDRGVVARGLGRSYGDAAQNAGGLVIDMRAHASLGPIDEDAGSMNIGAGTTIDSLLRYTIARGWFVPVTPGTRQITLGGAVAADVHGKNHHRDGSIASHVTSLTIIDGNGDVRVLTPQSDLFWATLGGMGLTGVVTEVTVRLLPVSSAWMAVDTYRTANLDETMSRLCEVDSRRQYSVAWLDCLARRASLGRGVVSAGDHVRGNDVYASDFAPRDRLAVPRWIPDGLLRAPTVAAFNELYFRAAPRRREGRLVPLAAFFYPLDVIRDWNRCYGTSGFVQYQFATPQADVVATAIEKLSSSRAPGFLAVLKRFGSGNRGPLSFPAPGWTLALDIPTKTDGLPKLLDELDVQVAASGGRVYLAKDARLRPDLFSTMYPEAAKWRQLRAVADPNRVFQSDIARRLDL